MQKSGIRTQIQSSKPKREVSDTRNRQQSIALERTVKNYWEGLLKQVLRAQHEVVQTFSWLLGSHDNPLTCQ